MYAFIGDLHLGVKLPNEQFLKSLDKFLGLIKEHKEPCHAIFVCGDMFERRLNIDELKFAAYVLVNLVRNYCGKERTHVPVYFIHGTSSHDQDQYAIFMPLLRSIDNVDVFYIRNASDAIVYNDKHVLFLPQEYGDAVDYSKLLAEDQHYDMIVGHGPIASQTKSPCKAANYEIIHSAELLGKLSDICVFGHYHGFTDFGNGVYYTGPWLQWKYGEDEPRVFVFCNDNMEIETVPNPFAMKFETIEIRNPEELREYMVQDITNPHRFIINSAPSDMETYRGIINANRSEMVKFQLEEVEDEDDLQLSVDEIVEAQVESVQPIPALSTFIKDKYGLDADGQLQLYEAQINKEEAT